MKIQINWTKVQNPSEIGRNHSKIGPNERNFLLFSGILEHLGTFCWKNRRLFWKMQAPIHPFLIQIEEKSNISNKNATLKSNISMHIHLK